MEASELVQSIIDIEVENRELKKANSTFFVKSLDKKDKLDDKDLSIIYKDFLKQCEVHKYLGIGPDTLTQMRIDGLPCYRLSERNIYYSKEDIKEFLLEREM